MNTAEHEARRDRALGALYGLALGDALGMPTQELSRARAEQLLAAGPVLLPGPAANPISAGLPAGSVTDDTEQALLLAQELVDGGGTLDPVRFASSLLDWQDRMAARGSLDLLGPTTRTALAAVRAGADPRTTGRGGATNGAAMRVAPLGVATPIGHPGGEPGSPSGGPPPTASGAASAAASGAASGQLETFVAAVAAACRTTHESPDAYAGAAAVAAVVSFGVQGAAFTESLPAALDAAALAADLASPGTGRSRDVPLLISRAVLLARRARASDGLGAALDVIDRSVGTSLATHESVPAAFAVAALEPDDGWAAAWLGARLGGDADTIGAMAGAMVGACRGLSTLPAGPLAVVRSVNRLDLSLLADQLLALRDGRA
jgi:ADP-ribosylglycohydrolase